VEAGIPTRFALSTINPVDGVALVTPRFEADCLATGKLVALFDITAQAGSSYYLAYPEENRNLRKVKLFRDWVLAEAADGASGASA